MGIMEDLRDSKKKPARVKFVETGPKKGIVSYRPTDKDKQEMARLGFGLNEALAVLEDKLQLGIKVTVTYNPAGHAMCSIVRDGNEAFGQGVAVAVNHNDVGKTLIGIAFYLQHVNPEYPSKPPQFFQQDFGW